MASREKQLTLCPVCSYALAGTDERCGRCRSEVVREDYYLDVSDRARYREEMESRRAAWNEFDGALRGRLREFGPGWSKSERWEELWATVSQQAARAGFDEHSTRRRARNVWSEIEPRAESGVGGEAEKPEPENGNGREPEDRGLAANLERIRQWVAALPDGELDVIAWDKFVETLDEPSDIMLLEAFRNQEIKRQFADFETAKVSPAGELIGRRRARVKKLVENLVGGSELVMLRVPRGEFRMGSERYAFERPVHRVKVAEFFLGQYHVTQAQWRAVARLPAVSTALRDDDSAFRGDDLPAECVSWPEAQEFCARLAKATGRRYRLPTEAEWEYACRAGSNDDFAFGETIITAVVNYDGRLPYGTSAAGTARGRTVAPGSLGFANDFGLYDMHGNVWEWCADEWHDNYDGAPADGAAWVSSAEPAYRVIRGGSWANAAEVCRSSDRARERTGADVKLHYLGLRVALDL